MPRALELQKQPWSQHALNKWRAEISCSGSFIGYCRLRPSMQRCKAQEVGVSGEIANSKSPKIRQVALPGLGRTEAERPGVRALDSAQAREAERPSLSVLSVQKPYSPWEPKEPTEAETVIRWGRRDVPPRRAESSRLRSVQRVALVGFAHGLS